MFLLHVVTWCGVLNSTDVMSTIKKYQRRPSGALHQAGGIEGSSVQNEDVQNNRDTSWV